MKARGRLLALLLVGIIVVSLGAYSLWDDPDIVERFADELLVRRGVETIDWFFSMGFYDLIAGLKRARTGYSFAPVRRGKERLGVIHFQEQDLSKRMLSVYACFKGTGTSGHSSIEGFDSLLMEVLLDDAARRDEIEALTLALETEPVPVGHGGTEEYIWKNAALGREAILIDAGLNDVICLATADVEKRLNWIENTVKKAAFTVKYEPP